MEQGTTCSYCGGAGGNAENLNHNPRCPRFGDEVGTEGLNALRDSAQGPATAPRPTITNEERERIQRAGAAARARFDAANRRGA